MPLFHHVRLRVAGGEEDLQPGTHGTHAVGKIRAWEPPHRLVFGWRQAAFTPDMDTEVEVTFEAVGEETRVSVTHKGWDSVPQTHVARHGFPIGLFLQRHGEWWQTLLARLRSDIDEGAT